MTDKILALLGFAAKAGKLGYGMNAAVSAAQSGRARLIAVSDGVSAKSQKEIAFHAGKKNIPVLILKDCDIGTVSGAVGRNCGIVSVNDRSFAGALLKAADSGRKC